MTYLYAIIYGLVQGLTEFLPVSSSGHLVLLHQYLKIPVSSDLSFDVALHSATMIAVIWYFRIDILELIKSWFKSFKNLKDGIKDLSWLILFATIPAALAGYFLDSAAEAAFRSPLLVALMMVLVGILFLVAERFSHKSDDLDQLDWKKALLIGCSQAVALIPGTSRSGITTITGMGLNLKRQAAIRFSFLVSIPVIAGATVKELPHLLKGGLVPGELGVLVVAFVVALFSGVFAIKFLLKYTRNNSLKAFAYYRFAFVLVIVLLVWFA